MRPAALGPLLISLLVAGGCGLVLELQPPPEGMDAALGDGGVGFDAAGRDAGATDAAVFRDAMSPDATSPDAMIGVPDGGVVCMPERCNGLDDDCDGFADEDFDLLTDALHCGACGLSCSSVGGSVRCVAGVCELTCAPGRADCDDDPASGCEADLLDPRTCGGCDRFCLPSEPVCRREGAVFECVIACAAPLSACDDACVDLQTDRSHCGACDSPCFVDEHGRVECASGRCYVADCGDGRLDCNGDASDGCESSLNTTRNCGGCGVVCPMGDVCVAGSCRAP